MTTSIFIPTTPFHIKYLTRILRYTRIGKVQPDEIIISISDYKSCDKETIDIINNIEKEYDVIIIKNEPLNPGPNRQLAKNYCKGDIIIYQDSDDVPHPRRVEIIKYFFENYDISHLNHSGVMSFNDIIIDFKEIELDKINIIHSDTIYKKYFPNNNIMDCLGQTNSYGSEFTKFNAICGPLAVKSEVLDTISWKDRKELSHSPNWDDVSYKGAEDYEFCTDVLFNLNKSMIIDAPIYIYCKYNNLLKNKEKEMKELENVASKYQTDKSFKHPYGHNYVPFYDMILRDMKNIKNMNMLEIGVFNGESLKMWKEYFDNSKIYGWDILDLRHMNDDKIEIFIVDQGKQDQIENFFILNPVSFDFVIDDGSHLLDDQIVSLFNVFPHLNSGGIYIIEDMWYEYFNCFLKIGYKKDYIKNIDGRIISLVGEEKLKYLLDNIICCQKNNVIFSSGEDKSDHQFYVFYKK